MSNGNEERLVNIESALAHVDQLTESLNETMVEQAKSIRRLTLQMDQLADRLAAEDMKAAKDNITKPPHYSKRCTSLINLPVAWAGIKKYFSHLR